MTTLDIDHLRSWIGREEVAEDIVTADLVRKFRAMLDLQADPPRVAEIAPRLLHFCLAQPAAPTAALGPDGHPQRGGFLPPVPLSRRMWAGGSVIFQGDLRVGDGVRRVSRIADVVAKEGRTGLLCFVAVDHAIEADGRPVLRERQDIVYRGPDGGGAKAPPAPAEPGRHRRRVDPSPPLLFRYSALTFNGHRIHYDRRYVMEVEGYPGLIVHGPLQATLLFNFAAELRGAPPTRFAFRSLSPLFDDDAFLLHAAEDGDGLKLWTARENGPVAMAAEAHWA
ncbi:MaoC family dehydratase N-terminal domain-containing protein [Inquilinus limosus]|uniref:FAS1-like dehydratase domain-containing protein n=1 Tax=Inquilinus limosus TaxID=171674 RepID=UPI003F143742